MSHEQPSEVAEELVEDKEEEKKEEGEVEEEEEPTPTSEKETPIPLTEVKSQERELEEVVDGNLEEEQEEEKESAIKLAKDENQQEEVTEEKVEKEDKKEEEEEEEREQEKEDKETEKDSSESEELQSENNTESVLVEEESQQKDGEEEKKEEEEEEEDDDDEEEEDEEEEDDDDENTTTADLPTDASFPSARPNSNKNNSVKTNGHVLLPPDGLRPNPSTTQGPLATSEPLLCPLVESEPSYTDRDNSLSSAYETFNGDLTNGSSDRHRLNMPFFPDLPLDPEPGDPVPDPGSAPGTGFGMVDNEPTPSSPIADRSRTVSSSSTGETPKGKESVK